MLNSKIFTSLGPFPLMRGKPVKQFGENWKRGKREMETKNGFLSFLLDLLEQMANDKRGSKKWETIPTVGGKKFPAKYNLSKTLKP